MRRPLDRIDVRLGLVCAGGVLALTLGALLLGGGETSRPLGHALAIAVVPPIEREVLPGETMEVGALNDSFDRAALERVADVPIPDTLPEPAWVGPAWSGPAGVGSPLSGTEAASPTRPVLVITSRAEAAPPAHADPLDDGSRAFGFDRARPDYAAERRARWDRLEASAPSAPPAPAPITVLTTADDES